MATFLAEDVKDPRIVGLVTVTGAEVTRDLRHAKVFVTIMGSEAEPPASASRVRRSPICSGSSPA